MTTTLSEEVVESENDTDRISNTEDKTQATHILSNRNHKRVLDSQVGRQNKIINSTYMLHSVNKESLK